MGELLLRSVGFIIGLIFAVALVCIVFGLPFMYLWNFVIPHVSGGMIKELTFWQACSFYLLLVFIALPFRNYEKK